LPVFLYITQHLLCFLLLIKSMRSVYALIGLVLFMAIAVLKEDTHDLIAYTQIIDAGVYIDYEFLFSGLIVVLKNFTISTDNILNLIQIILFVLIMFVAVFFRQKIIICALLAVLSVFLFMATNNVLRQGFSVVLLLYSMIFLLKKHYIISLAFVMMALLFHKSAIFFIIITYFIYVAHRLFGVLRLNYISHVIVIFLGILLSFGLSLLLVYTSYSNYYDITFFDGSYRVDLHLKIIPIAVLMMLIDYIMLRRAGEQEICYLKALRLLIVSLLVGLSVIGNFDEIGSRILFFYFGVELLYMMYLINFNRYRPVVAILFSYTFAFNVWNVLGGFSGFF